jgi:hypothetical protein
MLTQSPIKIQPKAGFSWQTFIWLGAWLTGLVALIFLFLVQPQTEVRLGPITGPTSLTGLNVVATIEPHDFGPLSPDGKTQRVSPGATLRLSLFSYRPLNLKLKLDKGRGPLQIWANGAVIGTVAGPELTGSYTFSFIPRLQNEQRPNLNLRFETATPFELSELSLDLSEQWQPVMNSEAESLLVEAAFLLLALALSGWFAIKRQGTNWTGTLTLIPLVGAVALSGLWLQKLLEVGPGGELNSVVYWGDIGSTFYLIGLSLTFVTTAIPLRQGRNLFELFQTGLSPFGRAIVTLTLFNALLTGLLFGPVALQNNGFDNLGRLWDGPEYLVNAHSLYDPADPLLKIPEFAQKSPIYWTAHFPLYSLVVRLIVELTDYLPALFLANFLFGTGFAIVLYRFLADFGYSRRPLWLAGLALFLPLRWLIYHTVGASEAATLFFFGMLTLYEFKRGRYWWSGLAGAGVVLSRPNGIFLYAGFGLLLAWDGWQAGRKIPFLTLQNFWQRWLANFNWRAALALSLMPLMLLAVFAFYGWRYGDFLAYLNIPENVKHIYPVPLLSLDITVGRSEGDFYYYLLQAGGLIWLWRERHYDLFWPGLALTLPTLFLLHDDVLRYALPAFPLVLLIPFAKILESRAAYWLALPTLLGVLIYSWSQLNTNLVSLETWQAMLDILQK